MCGEVLSKEEKGRVENFGALMSRLRVPSGLDASMSRASSFDSTFPQLTQFCSKLSAENCRNAKRRSGSQRGKRSFNLSRVSVMSVMLSLRSLISI